MADLSRLPFGIHGGEGDGAESAFPPASEDKKKLGLDEVKANT